ncbi:dimethylsulfonioproprionate lyase family protein [Caballeronia calidae]|uniref:dimethylsulfonioproprionate lyase family protein n=1 Tax=Caballeronia calidae TaxID=1777139 RepID=UPI00094111E2|nr:dimethylsulfonioproprionate lyase family protein [Caballeronia calidae]
MVTRPEDVEVFVRIAEKLFQSEMLPAEGRLVAARVFERLRGPSDDGHRLHAHFPAAAWIDEALAPVVERQTDLGVAARAIQALVPVVGWNRRTSGENGSPGYVDSHVHGIICGPGGAESRYDVQLGFTVMAPRVRYPDHNHPPQEAYVLFTEGEFLQEGGDWFSPGLGGGIHNSPFSIHAMRSGEVPFLAVWCLLV